MKNIFYKTRLFLIGRSYSEEISKDAYRLNLVDRPYFKSCLVFCYAAAATYVFSTYKKLGFAEDWLLILCVFAVIAGPLSFVFFPERLFRYTILDKTGWFLSPGFTVISFHGKISWKNISRIDKSIFGTSIGRSGFYIVARFYTITLKSGKTIEVQRVFTKPFEDQLLAIIRKKKIPFADKGIQHWTAYNKIYKLRARPLRWVACSASPTKKRWRRKRGTFACCGATLWARQIDGAWYAA